MSRKKCIVGLQNRNSRSLGRVNRSMRLLIVTLLDVIATAQTPGAREIIRRSVAASVGNWKVARNYTFLQRTEERQVDSAGRVKSKTVKTYDVTLLDGSPYFRLTERDD